MVCQAVMAAMAFWRALDWTMGGDRLQTGTGKGGNRRGRGRLLEVETRRDPDRGPFRLGRSGEVVAASGRLRHRRTADSPGPAEAVRGEFDVRTSFGGEDLRVGRRPVSHGADYSGAGGRPPAPTA